MSKKYGKNDDQVEVIKCHEKKKNKTIIFALHDRDIAKYVADKIIMLDQGNVIFDGVLKNFLKL